MKCLILVVAFSTFSLALNSQTSSSSLGSWTSFEGRIGIPKTNFSIDSDVQLRLYEPLSTFQEIVGRVGLTFHTYKRKAYTAGIARLHTNYFGTDFNENPTIENRLWQQLTFSQGGSKLKIEHRSRIEQRWINDGDIHFSGRIRQRILFKLNLGSYRYRYRYSTKFFVSIYDELFIGLSEIPFDQNRFYAGIGFNLGSKIKLQSGYLWQETTAESLSRVQFSVSVNTFHMKPPRKILYKKPIIYLYPQDTTEVQVVLDYAGELIHTYPKYNSGWKVKAYTDGTLIDGDGKEYYSLYWEGIPKEYLTIEEGFVIPGNETVEFLEITLAELGLNRREANEFTIYWLPEMENNPFNLIHFSSPAYEKTAKLIVIPSPETTIRVMMVFQPLNQSTRIPKQDISKLKKERKGFTVVEWGGQELPNLTP
jgi:hypothetical protein